MNLIVRNLPQPDGGDSDGEVFFKIANELDIDVEIENCETLGKPNRDSPQMLRVKVKQFKKTLRIKSIKLSD